MPTRKFKVGDELRLATTDETGKGVGLGNGPGSIPFGAEMTLEAFVDATEPGAGPDDEDCAVLLWQEPGTVIERRISVPVSQLHELFEEA